MSGVEFDQNLLAKVNILAGSLDGISNQPLRPFSPEALDFLAALSANLLADKAVRQYPDVVTFAYWCRKSNLAIRQAQAVQNNALLDSCLGRGLAFHIAPSNIPVNFAFSFVFALLAGNSSIVRVSSKPFGQTALIAAAINATLLQHPQIAKRCALISYPVDDVITTAFLRVADTRMIWGGDATIAKVLALPGKPRGKDILFADRYSVALIFGPAIAAASDKDLADLAQSFYNDTYLMDQNACSSPQMIFWQGASQDAKQRFWQAVLTVAKRQYDLQAAVAVDKYLQLCRDIIDGVVVQEVSFDGLLTVIETGELPADICHLRGTGGYFYQSDIVELLELAPLATERFQTMIYYGYDASELRQFVLDNQLRGIDRIVPFGAAMDIDLVWDGYDLISELSRIVDAR